MELGKVKARIEKISREKSISVQVAWDTFFFDEFIYRLSISRYKNNFIFKGGFYLQNILGVETRSTMDIDFKYYESDITNESLLKIFNEIIKISNNEIIFSIIGIDDIKAETKYGGKTIKIEAKYYNVKKRFGIDIGIGDIVTPEPVNYKYKSLFSNSKFDILAYSIETAIAEKFETLISKGTNNSRSKDLIDLYLLNKKGYDKFILNSALINTFYMRGTSFMQEEMKSIIDDVFSFERTKVLFTNYCSKNSFASNITLEDCKLAVYSIFGNIKFNKRIDLKDYGIELHVIRHGEDEQNKVGGWSDNHLTEVGIRQIKETKEIIDNQYDLFISSDLNRTKETSDIINEKLNMPIEYDINFREVNNGDFKNMTKEEFVSNHLDFLFSKLKMNQNYPNGESPNLFFRRIKANFYKLLENNKNKKILLVTHGGVITVIHCILNGIEYSNLLKVIPPLGSLIKYK